MKPLLVTSGEPAGIGPDLCLELAHLEWPVVVLADKALLLERSALLGRQIHIHDYNPNEPVLPKPGSLTVLSIPCPSPVLPGQLNLKNASYVIEMLCMATDKCLNAEFSALVTAPVHKAIINQAGMEFTGHTEFLAKRCGVNQVVMMLACKSMKVALVTTHLPLRKVADAITRETMTEVISILNKELQRDFGIASPKIWVAGLNPHAGESGHLGNEEIEVITPALNVLKAQGIDVKGPFPADTLFTQQNQTKCDVFVAMYHDQGLPIIKYIGFGEAVNITLGLPIIRTSVDHGTALDLAGKGIAQSSSLRVALETAAKMVEKRGTYNAH